MKISSLKINHMNNPLGFTLDTPRASWKVTEAMGTKQTAARIRISLKADMQELLWDSEWIADPETMPDSLGTVLPIPLSECTRYYWQVSVRSDYRLPDGQYEQADSDIAWFETGREHFAGCFITAQTEERLPSIQYMKTICLEKLPSRARAYACGLGLYELYCNGEKAGNEYLAPGFTGYDSWIQTQTIDILPLLKVGENKLTALTGDGEYMGRFGLDGLGGGHENLYGDKQAFLMDLVLEYGDGTSEVISTGEDWKLTQGKVRFSSIYDGETFDDTFRSDTVYAAKKADIDMPLLMPRLSLPVVEKEYLKPVEVLTSPKGETILDMGQNMVGWLTFVCREPAGTRVTYECGEILQDGCFFNENLRVAKQAFTYVSDGTERIVRPHFTYYGFRYVRLTGFTQEIRAEDFTGVVLYSDMERTGRIETDRELVNRLYENTLWGMKGNFVDVPTDCPQRDERLGWTGDAQVFCPTAAYHMDICEFMKKYCHDMKLEQRKFNGVPPMVVPAAGMKEGGSCGWADAATVIPWTVYLQYGDRGILEESYEGMKAWADHIYEEDEKSGGRRLWTTGFHFGDWLALDGENPAFPIGGTDVGYLCSCYYLISTTIVGKAADVLGLREDKERYERLAQEIRQAIRDEYITPAGRLALTNQTAYAMALYCGLAEDPRRLEDDFAAKLQKDKVSIKTGFLGTPIICRMLSEHGHNDLAYTLLLNEEMPGWLYCVKMGATTIWERWNSVLPDGKINPQGMNSLNHYSYGAIAEWMYRVMGGINAAAPGFRRITLAPMPDERMRHVCVTYEAASGTIKSEWAYTERGLDYRISVPFNVEGTLCLQIGSGRHVLLNGEEYAYEAQNGRVEIPVNSGNYHIEVI